MKTVSGARSESALELDVNLHLELEVDLHLELEVDLYFELEVNPLLNEFTSYIDVIHRRHTSHPCKLLTHR